MMGEGLREKYMVDRKKIIEEITESLYLIKRKVASDMHFLFHEMQITHPQWIVLQQVRKKGMISIKYLSHVLQMTSSAATQIVNGLVKKGLLVRKRNKEDRRMLNIELSETAYNQFELMKDRRVSAVTTLFDSLDDEDLIKYLEINKKIAEKIPGSDPGRRENKYD